MSSFDSKWVKSLKSFSKKVLEIYLYFGRPYKPKSEVRGPKLMLRTGMTVLVIMIMMMIMMMVVNASDTGAGRDDVGA